MKQKISLIITIFIYLSFIYTNQIHVPIDHEVYLFIDRMSIKGHLPRNVNSTLPLSRHEVKEMLDNIYLEKDKLSIIEKNILDELLINFSDVNDDYRYYLLEDNQKVYNSISSYSNIKNTLRNTFFYDHKQPEHHFIVYEDNDQKLMFDIGGISRIEVFKKDNRLIYSYSYRLAYQHNKICLYSDADLYSIIYNKPFRDYPFEFKGGYPLTRAGFYGYENEMSFEYANSYIEYLSDYGKISFNVEPIVWGLGNYPIILSNNTPPFPMISWSKKIGNSQFSFLHGSLHPASSDSIINDLMLSDKKFLVGHRWEVYLSKKLQLAFTEMLVYGGRDTELYYLFPTIFLWPVQHNMTSESEDNILWFFEGQYLLFNDYKIYGTFMLDELRTTEIFNDWIGNRWIAQVGFQISKTILSLPTDFEIEFIAARPWAYTHRVPKYGTYTHHGRSLGYKYGPNSQLISFVNRWWLNSRSSLSIFYEKLIYGQEPIVDIDDGYDFGNDPNHNYLNANMGKYQYSTKWLIGDIQTNQALTLLYSYQLTNTLKINIQYDYKNLNNKSFNTTAIQLNIDY